MEQAPGMKDSNQYLTFRLADVAYAIDVSNVREILEIIPITKIPRTPDFMRGVINNRGSVVPVVDMRLKFGMAAAAQSVETCIIVIEIGQGGDSIVIGALVDSVEEVIQLEPDQIEPPPKLRSNLNSEFLKGIGKKENRFILILEIGRMFTGDELVFVQQAGEGVAPAPADSQ
jgi:purine-binding chemotaxis protein CheW